MYNGLKIALSWFRQVIEDEKLCENAEKMGKVLFSELSSLNPKIVPIVRGRGLLCCLGIRPQGSKCSCSMTPFPCS